MALNIFWKIPFVSLRSGTLYTVNIWKDATLPSGYPLTLKGGAQPLTTEEDASDDQFTPIRTVTGRLRIMDNAYAMNAAATPQQVAFNWKDLVPKTDTDRPVTITHQSGGATVTDWSGYMQAQSFSGVLYEQVQEREYPIQCPLSILPSKQVATNIYDFHNFAWLLHHILGNTGYTYSYIYVGGGADARTWLSAKFDWQNFLSTDKDENVISNYDLYEVLEDVCRFWGWTARTKAGSFYLTCADDASEQTFLKLTLAELEAFGNENTPIGTLGTIENFTSVTLSGNIFASVDNEDYTVRGPAKATVKADVNEDETVIQFAPKPMRDTMDARGYQWHQGDGNLVGYFATPPVGSLECQTLKIDKTSDATSSKDGFERRQIYSTQEASDATKADMIICDHDRNDASPVTYIKMRTKYPRSFGGGSIRFTGSLWKGAEQYTDDNEIIMRLGIGLTESSAKWWYMPFIVSGGQAYGCEWKVQQSGQARPTFLAPMRGGSLRTCGVKVVGGIFVESGWFITDYIPVETGLNGYIFIEFCSCGDGLELGNFAIEFSRDETVLPTSSNDVRPRTMVGERDTEHEYTATNQNQCQEEWNADCIFASDNNMKFGHGLLMLPNGNYLSTLSYGSGAAEHPEQHLANRVASFWTQNKRMIIAELRTNTIADITPQHKVTLDGTICHPIAISRNWRDDITTLNLLQMPQ